MNPDLDEERLTVSELLALRGFGHRRMEEGGPLRRVFHLRTNLTVGHFDGIGAYRALVVDAERVP